MPRTTNPKASCLRRSKNQDLNIFAINGFTVAQQDMIVDCAVTASVMIFVSSEFGCNTLGKEALELLPVYREKLTAVDYLCRWESEGMSWTSFFT